MTLLCGVFIQVLDWPYRYAVCAVVLILGQDNEYDDTASTDLQFETPRCRMLIQSRSVLRNRLVKSISLVDIIIVLHLLREQT